MGQRMTRPCPYCGRTGIVELTGVYAETLALLIEQNQELNGAALARLAGCKPEAMANRLVALQRMGLALGRRHGRERLWRTTEKEQPS